MVRALAIRTLPLAGLLFLSPQQEPPSGKTEEAQLPAQIELFQSKVRFESNGDSRKEVHCIVRINSELGARQFATLKFDYNRAFENIEIPFVRVTHSSGGTADILPSAVSDYPNPAVTNFPGYHDVRVKSVRILGLAPSDTLEYRVITTVTHHPLAPDFWLDHSFDRTGVVSHEVFELDLPHSPAVRIRVSPATPAASTERAGAGADERDLFRWDLQIRPESKGENAEADVALTTFASWEVLAQRLRQQMEPNKDSNARVAQKAAELAGDLRSSEDQIRALYDFVSQKIATVDLPLGTTGFRTRSPSEVLASGQATAEDKFALFQSLAAAFDTSSVAALTGGSMKLSDRLPRPSLLTDLLIVANLPPRPASRTGCSDCDQTVWMAPAVEVAPFGVLPASLRGRQALAEGGQLFQLAGGFLTVPATLPFPSTQKVAINAQLGSDGTLSAKVSYVMRGDNELLLRVAFHQSPREKWKEVAQLLSLSDGFRGKVSSVSASDPYDTRSPFTVEYEISQPKFVDWSKKPVRIPAVLPLVGLPDPPADAGSPIELGTPLEVETKVRLRLPPGTTVESPAGTAVDRDYATFSSQYSAAANTITASRHIHFISRQLPADRAADYSAFLRAVQNDQSQLFRLTRPDAAPPKSPATSKNR
jgi:hypothetical protein